MDIKAINQVLEQAKCLYSEQEVEKAITRMGETITKQLSNKNLLVFCILNGGLIFTGQLLTKMPFPLELSYIHPSRYRGNLSGGKLDWIVQPTNDVEGRNILIIDDILDEGYTLQAVINFFQEQHAKKIYTAVLIDKKHDRKAKPEFKADFHGLDIDDHYIFGYGLDYKGYWRNANGIYALNK